MNKDFILKTINKYKQEHKLNEPLFKWSEPIIDDYLSTQKGIFNVKGYGIYDSDASNRFCLVIDLPNNHKKESLTTLLMNPADTFPINIAKTKGKKSRFDQTIRNLIILANAIGYKQIIVLNTFPYIEGNGEKANRYYENNKLNNKSFDLNKEFIKVILNQNNEILIACGDSINPNLYSDYFKIIKEIKTNCSDTKLLTYAKGDIKGYCTALTKKYRPRHLSLQSPKNKKQYNIAISEKKLYELNIVDSCFKLK